MKGALTRYRIMAWVVGVLLVVLTLVAMPMKYVGGDDTGVIVVAPIHGWLYVVYLMTVADLARRVEWPFRRTVLVALAGTIPFVSFVVEHKVRGWVRLPEQERPLSAV